MSTYIYSSYFDTTGGNNFVRAYADYKIFDYTDKILVRIYSSGVNVKSGYHTNAMFKNTLTLNGVKLGAATVDNKNWYGGNHAILSVSESHTYDVYFTKKSTPYSVTLTSAVRASNKSASRYNGTAKATITVPALQKPALNEVEIVRTEGLPTEVNISGFVINYGSNPVLNLSIDSGTAELLEVTENADGTKAFSKTKTIGAGAHSIVLNLSDTLGSTTQSLTLPATQAPYITATAVRESEKINVQSDIEGAYGDVISDIKVVFHGVNTVEKNIAGATLPSSGHYEPSSVYVTEAEIGGEGSVLVEVSCMGLSGQSNTFTYKVPSKFVPLEVSHKGKLIVLGNHASGNETVPENGLLKCVMDIDLEPLKTLGFATGNLAKLINYLGDTYEIHKNGQDGYSTNEMILAGCVKVAWGYSEITPSKANTSTYKDIQLGTTFQSPPYVLLSLSGAPQIAALNLSVNSISVDKFNAHIYASNTTTRNFRWLAIGLAEDSETIKNLK